MSEISTDYWLSPESNLKMPKKEIGDYVESQGFLVPRRFNSLAEALEFVSQGGEIIIRSEHPEEYNGPSGLTFSHVITPESTLENGKLLNRFQHIDLDQEIPLSHSRCAWTAGAAPGYIETKELIIAKSLFTDPDITMQRIKTWACGHHDILQYAQLTKRSIEELAEGLTYSFWEHLPGTNATLVADTSIESRYHLLAYEQRYQEWHVIENGKSILGTANLLHPEIQKTLITYYEAVRNLPMFDQNHCPIMEFQVNNNKIWFLQYHRTRDFEKPKSVLDPKDFSPSEGWRKTNFARGSFDSPSTLNLGFQYSHYLPLPETEDASADYHMNRSLMEVMSRRRQAYVEDGTAEDVYSTMIDNHHPRSCWFKPKAAVACGKENFKKLFPEKIIKEVARRVYIERRMARLVIDLAVDGVCGYIRLNPDNEQPIYTEE